MRSSTVWRKKKDKCRPGANTHLCSEQSLPIISLINAKQKLIKGQVLGSWFFFFFCAWRQVTQSLVTLLKYMPSSGKIKGRSWWLSPTKHCYHKPCIEEFYPCSRCYNEFSISILDRGKSLGPWTRVTLEDRAHCLHHNLVALAD